MDHTNFPTSSFILPYHQIRIFSCSQELITGAGLASSLGQQIPLLLQQNKINKKNFNIPSFKQESIKSIQFLNKIPQHPFQASISASLKIIQRWTISYKCNSSPEFFLGQTSSSKKSLKPYLLLLYLGTRIYLGSFSWAYFQYWFGTSRSPTCLKGSSPYYTAL